jgi:hypothetical protein
MHALAEMQCQPGLDRVLRELRQAGHALWIITMGDLIRQAIKLSCFPLLERLTWSKSSTGKMVRPINACSPRMAPRPRRSPWWAMLSWKMWRRWCGSRPRRPCAGRPWGGVAAARQPHPDAPYSRLPGDR